MRWTSVVWVAACAAAPPRSADPPEVPADTERHYAIWFGGARVGTAHETEQWSPAGVVVRRTEAMRFLRGDAPVTLATTIEITADRRLTASRVTWTEQAQAQRRGDAVRDATGWTVTGDAGVQRLPERAIPAELAPLVVRRDGRFAGLVFLPARGFVAGAGRIDPVAPGRLIARLDLAAGATAEATIDLGDDAMPSRVVDGEGVIAIRVTAAEASLPFAPVDLIAATSIALTGTPSHRLVLDGDLALPPVPGQAPRAVSGELGAADGSASAGEPAAGDRGPGGSDRGPAANDRGPGGSDRGPAANDRGPGGSDRVELELSARLRGGLPPGAPGPDRTREIAALVARVHGHIAPDLGADPTSVRTAAAATAGDCTTFALAYAALAAGQAIPTLIVTGFRVDGDRLVRHRWAVSWTGRAWIAVDAAFGAVPAGGDLVGLAIHDADAAGLVAGEAALIHLRAAAWK